MRLVLTSALFGCLAACSGSSGEASAQPVCDMAPVIFVHGLGQHHDLFAPATTYLRDHGVRGTCLHAIELEPEDGDNIRAAEEQIAPFVEKVLSGVNSARGAAGLAPVQKVQMVGHSMGALSARWYTAIVAPARVATFISTSGANHGTNWQCSSPYGAGHRQMCPAFARSASESALQFRLNGARGADVDETPFGLGRDAAGVQRVPPDEQRAILYVTLRIEGDPYIVPAASLELDGAGGAALSVDAARVRESSPGNFVLRARSGHDELLSSADTLQWLLQVVRHQQSRTP